MNKEKLSESGYLVLAIAIAFMVLIGISKNANAQQTQAFVECTAGDFSAEVGLSSLQLY